MSKAFTKEDDSGELRLDDLPQSPHPNLVTPSGLAALEARLQARRADLAALQDADEGVATKLEVATAERDIRFLEERVNRAIVVDPEDQRPDIVGFGAEIEVLDQDDVRHTFRIVGEDAADPARGLITRFSPLGVALLGAELGSTVEWKRPRGTAELEILTIGYETAARGR